MVNKDRFKNFVHYVIFKTSSMPKVGATVLNKILYFTDFNYFEVFMDKLSTEDYIKQKYGPVPFDIDVVIKELKNDMLITKDERINGIYSQTKYSSLVKPTLSDFTEEQIKFIDDSIEKYSKLNAKELTELSHKDTPYIAANDYETLNYKLVFYRDAELAVCVE